MRTAPLVLGVFLALCLVSLGLWLFGGDAAAPQPVPAPVATPRPAPLHETEGPAPVIHLAVLNGTGQRDLAGETSLLLGRADCVVDRVGNAPHDAFERSLLVNRRLPEARARALAARLGGVPVIRERDPDATEDAVLVLGADHAAVRAALSGKSAQ